MEAINTPVSKMWKVPFRAVYCTTFKQWVKSTFWCHVVIKIFPNTVDFGSMPLLDECLESPKFFHDQYRNTLVRAKRAQEKS